MKNDQDRRENFGIFMLGAEATFSGSLMRGEHQELRFLPVPPQHGHLLQQRDFFQLDLQPCHWQLKATKGGGSTLGLLKVKRERVVARSKERLQVI